MAALADWLSLPGLAGPWEHLDAGARMLRRTGFRALRDQTELEERGAAEAEDYVNDAIAKTMSGLR